MHNESALLIEKNALIREGLKSLFRQSEYKNIVGVSCIEDVQSSDTPNAYDVIILGVNSPESDILSSLATLKSMFQNSKIVILSSVLNSE